VARENFSVFKGYLKNDKREGAGKREYDDGSIEVGEWRGDMLFGVAKKISGLNKD
jgi:hypothetical protein